MPPKGLAKGITASSVLAGSAAIGSKIQDWKIAGYENGILLTRSVDRSDTVGSKISQDPAAFTFEIPKNQGGGMLLVWKNKDNIVEDSSKLGFNTKILGAEFEGTSIGYATALFDYCSKFYKQSLNDLSKNGGETDEAAIGRLIDKKYCVLPQIVTNGDKIAFDFHELFLDAKTLFERNNHKDNSLGSIYGDSFGVKDLLNKGKSQEEIGKEVLDKCKELFDKPGNRENHQGSEVYKIKKVCSGPLSDLENVEIPSDFVPYVRTEIVGRTVKDKYLYQVPLPRYLGDGHLNAYRFGDDLKSDPNIDRGRIGEEYKDTYLGGAYGLYYYCSRIFVTPTSSLENSNISSLKKLVEGNGKNKNYCFGHQPENVGEKLAQELYDLNVSDYSKFHSSKKSSGSSDNTFKAFKDNSSKGKEAWEKCQEKFRLSGDGNNESLRDNYNNVPKMCGMKIDDYFLPKIWIP